MAGASGGGTQGGNSSAPGASTATGPFSWNGASIPKTTDPKAFGTQLLGDLKTAYGQGPKINPVSPFTPLSSQTTGLIGQAVNNAQPGGVLSQYANGSMIGNNPYLNDIIRQNDNQTTQNVNSTFNSSGLFGSDVHAQGLATGLQNSDNNLRYQDYQNGFSNMLSAQGQQNSNTNNALNATGLLDQNAAQQTAANSTMWDRQNNAPYNQIANYLSLLNSGNNSSNTNQPTSLWNILGGAGSIIGSLL